jgi:type IV secretory pathway TrbF-like protein
MQTKPRSKSQASAAIPDFAPGPVGQAATQEFFERGGKVAVERNRLFLIAALCALALAINGAAWWVMLPLKSVEPIVVRQTETGRLAPDEQAAGNWSPDRAAIVYFLNQWVASIVEINRATIEESMLRSAGFTTGNGKSQLKAYYARNNPWKMFEERPNLLRSFENISTNFVNDETVLVRYRTITRLNPGDQGKTEVFAMTINFVKVKPKTREDVLRNPAGLFITNFNIAEESQK